MASFADRLTDIVSKTFTSGFDKQRASWLALSTCCGKTLELTLDLLGLEVPERM